MPDIVTTAGDPPERPSVGVTQMRSIGTSSRDSMRDGVRLGMVVSISLAVLVGIYLLGIIGHRAGFALAIGVPSLSQTAGEAFVDGLMVPVSLLNSIYSTGVRDPLLFTGALVILLPPIAALVIARPRQRGGSPVRKEVRTAAGIGAALVVLADILIAVRTTSSTGSIIKNQSSNDFATWIESMEATAAVDLVALTISILLAVLIFRLPIDTWVRATVGTIAIITCVITSAATAASGGAVAGFDQPRSLVTTGNNNMEIILGTTPVGEYAVIRHSGNRSVGDRQLSRRSPVVTLRLPEDVEVTPTSRSQTVRDFLLEPETE